MEYHALLRYNQFTYWLLEDYYTNWLEPPPGVRLEAWVNTFCEILSNFLDIRVAARSFLASKVVWLCKRQNSVETGIYPTVKDIFYLVRKMKIPLMSHTARYQETIVNRLEGLITVFGDHISSRRRMNWQRYLCTDWAISLDGIPSDLQNLFIATTIAKIMLHRIVNNMRSASLVDLFVFDEGSTVFKRNHEFREGTYLLTDYMAQAREFGMGFLIGTQTISHIADSVLANTAIKVMVGGAGLGGDYDAFAASTGMTHEQKAFLRQLTRPGQACAKDPRYPFPFTLEVPRIA
jgi:hypothetical protein